MLGRKAQVATGSRTGGQGNLPVSGDFITPRNQGRNLSTLKTGFRGIKTVTALVYYGPGRVEKHLLLYILKGFITSPGTGQRAIYRGETNRKTVVLLFNVQ